TGNGNRIDVGLSELIVRLVPVIGNEINSRAVFGPRRVAIAVTSAGQLFRSHLVFAGAGSGNQPDVRRVFEIQITGVIRAIDRAGDHAHVALVLFRPGTGAGRRRW